MTRCPRCGHKFVPSPVVRSEDAFELFHALRDQFAHLQSWSAVVAKNWLCVHYGVAIEYEPGKFLPPKWPGIFVEVDNWWHFRKSTLAYTKDEMARLIDGTTQAIIEAGGEVV